jgi:abortive infection bacteriophage resistance protein
LRNICAHYGRLYFRAFSAIPAMSPPLAESAKRGLFGAIMALKALYPDQEKWEQEIYTHICGLFDAYQGAVKLEHLGFPLNWREILKVKT